MQNLKYLNDKFIKTQSNRIYIRHTSLEFSLSLSVMIKNFIPLQKGF